ncbi:DotA/TraY family protein [Caballeronia sp. EK]|uniref:DotA/TraY family protein n=1 Tax=Caballeronia sp. EK TaxID=2767469 RepID=UPI00210651F3|nr:DotA/TraY family protein [Caballeronia sp. EK]
MNNRCRLGLASVLAIAMCSAVHPALAQTNVSMGDITAAANRSGDKSMSLLQLVYGSIVQNPLSSGGNSGGGMIGSMFLVLNACFLAVGVIWAMYHFGSAMIATGQDGEFLGQKKSSTWYVIRMGAGFTSLVPIFGGYCGAQVIMLWATMMGVGIANLTMDAATTALASGGSMISTPVSPQATSLAKALFEANLCSASANTAIANMPADSGVSVDSSETFGQSSTSNKIVLMNRNGLSCGGAELTLTDPSSTPLPSHDGMAVYEPNSTSAVFSQMQSAHQAALTAMQSSLSSAAQSYVASVNGGQAPQDAGSIIDNAAHQYEATINAAINASSSSLSGLASELQSNLRRDGWIMMGAWYQTFAQANAQVSGMSNATATGVPPTDLDALPYPQLYRKVQAVYDQQIQRAASTSTTSTLVGNLSAGVTEPKSIMARIFNGQAIVRYMVGMNSGQGPAGTTNPLIGMKNLGDRILDAGWGALGAYVGIRAIDGGAQKALSGWAGKALDVATGGVAGALSGAASGVLSALTPFVVMILTALFFFGAMLSIYIPMLPFIIWFGGVVSWFAVVGEGLIAAPLWGMTHLDGDGEGMSQKSTHGYIFMLNAMFRPVFMIIGFVLGGGGVVVLGTLLNSMFGVALANAQFDSTTGLVSIIGFIVLYVGMCQTLCNACFGLINVVPDQVFSWIGGSMAGRVGSDVERDSKGHFGASTGQGKNAASSMTASMVKPNGDAGRVGGAGAGAGPGEVSRSSV